MTKQDFIKLKANKFIYCGKHYTEKRYISKDHRFYITSDNGFRYTMVYKGNEQGKHEIIYDAYYQGNYSSYPIYDLDSAIEKLNELNIHDAFPISIHEPHFEKTSKRYKM